MKSKSPNAISQIVIVIIALVFVFISFPQNLPQTDSGVDSQKEILHLEFRQLPFNAENSLNLKPFEFNFCNSFRTLISSHSSQVKYKELVYKEKFENFQLISIHFSSLIQEQGFYLYTLQKLLI